MKRYIRVLCIIVGLFSSQLFADLSALDPSIVGASARPIGMGGMFVSVAGDPSSAIYNPAAVARIDQFKLFSLSTRTLQEVNYLNYGFVFPMTKVGVWGLSLVSRSVNRVPLTGDLVMNGGEVDYSGVRYESYTDQVILLTYAAPLTIADTDVDIGLNAKFFKKQLTSISTANANGFNLDLGTRFSWTKHCDIGLKFQNILQSGDSKVSSGTLLWGTGEVESIDAYAILGVSNRTLIRNVLVGIDFRKNMSRSMYPTTVHLGAEWHPFNPLFLRCGYGQYLMAPDVSDEGNLTVMPALSVGMGLNFYGWRLDYAYRPDSEIKELASHWFSLSLVGDEPVEAVAAVPTQSSAAVIPTKSVAVTRSALIVTAPDPQTVTTAMTVMVCGSVDGSSKVLVNGLEQSVSPDKSFAVSVDVHIGLNDITVALPNQKIKQILKVLRLVSFKDLDGSPYKKDIVDLATLGLIRGDYPDRFNPKRAVSRSELATLIVNSKRTIRRPFQLRGVLDDVDILSAQGIIVGFPGGELRPQDQLTRGQLAVVLARLQGLAVAADTKRYSYLAQEHWAESAVQALSATGLYQSEEFSPRGSSVTKEEMAGLLSRLPLVRGQIEALYSFDESLLTEEPKTAEEQPLLAIQNQIPVQVQQQAATPQEMQDDDIALFNQLIAEDSSATPTPAAVVKKKVLPKPLIQKTKTAKKVAASSKTTAKKNTTSAKNAKKK